MQICHSLSELRVTLGQLRSNSTTGSIPTVGFVPTMGNLHQGHITLVQQAKTKSDIVVVSIFVNPLQFERQEDLDTYPKTIEQDCTLLEEEHVDVVFLPTIADVYPHGLKQQTFVTVPGLSTQLEGAARPGHFVGVATIVAKLFCMVQPTIACFGEKDYQQLAVIRRMVEDLSFPIEIVAVPTVRDTSSQLALSSRNGLLTPTQYEHDAPQLYQGLLQVRQAIRNNIEHQAELQNLFIHHIEHFGFKLDAFDVVDADTLQPINDQTTQIVVLVAAFLGSVRLIDNIVVPRNLHE